MDKLQSKYNAYLSEAVSRVGNEYYKIKTTYGEIVRERVFCYEFYHQLRLLQKRFSLDELSLSAEIDKRGHQEIRTSEQRNPDLIFHKYGEFESNEIIIEVKGK
ncbi:hypothetical protein CW734_04535 [Planococcus sp. MB-3u-03]|nr:hypothetical protein [Planococcus sp. MB-3u-03]AUD13081.1 hypothetical protein CW734_04535 [Planococcus sp. MB-3u-03]